MGGEHLGRFAEGEEVVIKGTSLEEELRFRLYYMGLYPGSRVKIVRNDGRYPLLVEAHGSLIAISTDIAEKIYAEKVVERGVMQ
ncbi:MAG: FeoA family protein [Acidilobaceae archaeon]